MFLLMLGKHGRMMHQILESEVSVFREESKSQIDQWTGDQLIEMY